MDFTTSGVEDIDAEVDGDTDTNVGEAGIGINIERNSSLVATRTKGGMMSSKSWVEKLWKCVWW